MHLFLVRHGYCLGQSDPASTDPDSALSALGEEQALLTAKRLAEHSITAVLSSPLIRALATATIIAQALERIPVEVWPDLREGWSTLYRSLGRHALLERFPSIVLPAAFSDEGWEHPGETYAALVRRVQDLADVLRGRFQAEERVVVVTHGGFANYLLQALLRLPSGCPLWFELANGAISHVRVVPREEQESWPLYPAFELEVLCLNDRAHLGSTTS